MKLIIQLVDTDKELILVKKTPTLTHHTMPSETVVLHHDWRGKLDPTEVEDRINVRRFGYEALKNTKNTKNTKNRLRIFRILDGGQPMPVELWNDYDLSRFSGRMPDIDFWIDKDGDMRNRSGLVVFRGPDRDRVEA